MAYSEAETSYRRLKALLEGAVYESPTNVLAIATSNHRNLVREPWADRPDSSLGEPAAWDTLQEKLALADRFGLTLTFPASRSGHVPGSRRAPPRALG